MSDTAPEQKKADPRATEAMLAAVLGYSSLPLSLDEIREIILGLGKEIAKGAVTDPVEAARRRLRELSREKIDAQVGELTGTSNGTLTKEMPGMLSKDEWDRIRRSVPIVCVDLVPIRYESGRPQVGLIQRETRGHGLGYTLIGGRMQLDEGIHHAIYRQLHESLGTAVSIRLRPPHLRGVPHPDTVSEYSRVPKPGIPYDEDKNSVSLTYVALVEGHAEPRSEAISFTWFDLDQVPGPEKWGYNQYLVAADALARLGWACPPLGVAGDKVRARETARDFLGKNGIIPKAPTKPDAHSRNQII